jgi:hypothetical protein
MNRIVSLTALALLAAPATARAQQPTPPTAGPLAAARQAVWQRAARNMPAAADSMPAEKYGFKPTPEQMSFGEIIAHEQDWAVHDSQAAMYLRLNGILPPSARRRQ